MHEKKGIGEVNLDSQFEERVQEPEDKVTGAWVHPSVWPWDCEDRFHEKRVFLNLPSQVPWRRAHCSPYFQAESRQRITGMLYCHFVELQELLGSAGFSPERIKGGVKITSAPSSVVKVFAESLQMGRNSQVSQNQFTYTVTPSPDLLGPTAGPTFFPLPTKPSSRRWLKAGKGLCSEQGTPSTPWVWVIDSQNVLSWKRPIRIIEFNSWPCTGHSKNPITCLKVLSKHFWNFVRQNTLIMMGLFFQQLPLSNVTHGENGELTLPSCVKHLKRREKKEHMVTFSEPPPFWMKLLLLSEKLSLAGEQPGLFKTHLRGELSSSEMQLQHREQRVRGVGCLGERVQPGRSKTNLGAFFSIDLDFAVSDQPVDQLETPQRLGESARRGEESRMGKDAKGHDAETPWPCAHVYLQGACGAGHRPLMCSVKTYTQLSPTGVFLIPRYGSERESRMCPYKDC
ncbi:hypothetical protein BTVI_116554 [Pitangus sulphuratus]|nr:hypothetical protein BTVI_116554 [Pitangus sulphuratus]